MDEFELIHRFFERPARGTAIGIGDDAAIVQASPGTELYIAVDTLVAGRHFPESSPAESVGHRSMAVNLSDLAAMAANPRWFTLALTLPEVNEHWLEDFARGMFHLADASGIDLIGGDTTEGPLTVTVQVLGEAPKGVRVLRKGATAGDDIYVTGTLGDAAAGLCLMKAGTDTTDVNRQFLVDRFLWPKPRLDLSPLLREFAHAAIDISDGLLADLNHILAASSVGAVIDVESLPISSALGDAIDSGQREQLALTGGDDYEICFAASPTARAVLDSEGVTRIGTIVRGNSLTLRRRGEVVPLPSELGYRHLRNGDDG